VYIPPICTITQVEVSLLLHDVLYPDQMVPEEGVRTEARKQWQPPQPTDSFLKVIGYTRNPGQEGEW
jgi:hypothetical protein